LLLCCAWLFAFRAALVYLGEVFATDVYRLNTYLALAAAGLILHRLLRDRAAFGRAAELLRARPSMRIAPLALLAAALAGGVLFTRILDIRLFAAVTFGLGTYALAGLYVSAAAWRRALPAALLLVAALPFGEQASTYVGFTARVFTARAVEELFGAFGLASMSANAILQLESGVAYVDVPCSGIKSLWTGAVFFLAATFLEDVKLGARWLCAAAAFATAILAANTARVAAIVLIASVAKEPRAADLLHEPLGVIGFGAACALGFLMLRLVPKYSCTEDQKPESTPHLAPALAMLLFAAGAFTDRPASTRAAAAADETPAAPAIALEMKTTPLTLTDAERGLLGRVGGSTAEKLAFDNGTLAGTAVFIATDRFRAHHPPEICLASAGARIDVLEDLSFGPNRDARLATLDRGARTALYFYQSGEHTTGDMLERLRRDLLGGERRWVLVSILIDRPVPAADPALAELYEQFRVGVMK
jgi:exosortase O